MLYSLLAGDEGFEPPNNWTKTSRLTAWLIPCKLFAPLQNVFGMGFFVCAGTNRRTNIVVPYMPSMTPLTVVCFQPTFLYATSNHGMDSLHGCLFGRLPYFVATLVAAYPTFGCHATLLKLWCEGRDSSPHDQWSRDFKSLASTNFATLATVKARPTIASYFSRAI